MGGFGDFTSICRLAPLPLCSEVGPITSVANGVGIDANCFSRNIELANTLIFQGAASFTHIIVLINTLVMVFHVRGKFTAVGRSIPSFVVPSGPYRCQLTPVLFPPLQYRPQGDHHVLLHLLRPKLRLSHC